MASSPSADENAMPQHGEAQVGRKRMLPVHLAAALDRVDSVITALCSLLMAATFAVVIWAVFCRYVLNSSLMWGEELARYLSIWMICLGLGLAHRRGAHVAVNSALGWVPRIPKRVVTFIAESVTFVLCVLITWFSWLSTKGNFESGQLSPAMGIDIAWIYLALPVGFALMSLQSAIRLVAPDQYRDEQELL